MCSEKTLNLGMNTQKNNFKNEDQLKTFQIKIF